MSDVEDHVRSVSFASRCFEIVNMDAVWTGSLADGTERMGPFDRLALEDLGNQMALRLDWLQREQGKARGIFQRCEDVWDKAETVNPWLHENREQFESGLPHYSMSGMIERARKAIDHIATHGAEEAVELRRKVSVLEKEGNLPPGDLSKHMRAAIVFVAGAVLVATAVLMAVGSGAEASTAMAAAVAGLLAAGGPLLHVAATTFVQGE
ncbi:hypothetical protein [Streptomyces sp. NPDC054975]